MSHDAGTPEVDSAAEVAEDLPRRSPLSQRGLTKQQWAELQQQQATIKLPRKPLSFQYPAGTPPCSFHHTLRQLMPLALCLHHARHKGAVIPGRSTIWDVCLVQAANDESWEKVENAATASYSMQLTQRLHEPCFPAAPFLGKL